MNIVVDGFPLRVRSAGIQTYTYELLRQFVRIADSHEFFLSDFYVPLPEARVSKASDAGQFREAFQRLRSRVPWWWRFTPLAVRDFANRPRLRKLPADIYFGTNYLGLFAPHTKTVITIHDMCFVRHPETISWFILRHIRRRLRDHAHRADAIFTVSAATRRDVIEILEVPEEKAHVIYNGIGDEFRPVGDEAALSSVRTRYGLPSRFLLFVGTVEPRKNLVRLVESFKLLTKPGGIPHSLVVVGGKGWADKAIYQALEPLRAEGRAVLTGRADQQDLPLIYSLADAFVFPSLCEGFGIPIIEAMACGTPVVTSSTSCMPEVAGGAAVLVDPLSVESIAAGVRRAVEDTQLREELRRKGLARAKDFSWESAARKALDIFQRLARR